jgi:hypothetical protein
VFDDVRALDVAITPQAELFAHHLRVAAGAGELAGGDEDTAVTALVAGFYGVPLALGEARLDELAAAYRTQLDRVVAGAGAER